MSKADEMSYEDFNNVIKNLGNRMDKESFETIMEIKKSEEDYEKKIDELANEYFVDIPNKNIFGYYKILEYCIEKIKQSDKNLRMGFGNSLGIQKEETNDN